VSRPVVPLEVRFWTKVLCNIATGCWLWTGAITWAGYGRVFLYRSPEGRIVTAQAHWVSLQLAGIEVPDGLVLDHLCGNRLCVRPNHLEPVTPRVNCLRGRCSHRRNGRDSR
jgi:hypothetical protein